MLLKSSILISDEFLYINIKSLNERISDIPLLIKYFSKKIANSYNIKELEIDDNDSYILNHNWQGNVRELRNLIERIAILQPDTKDKISSTPTIFLHGFAGNYHSWDEIFLGLNKYV